MSAPDEPELYIRSFVTFIDILGFRNLVESDPTGRAVFNTLQLVSGFALQEGSGLFDTCRRAIRFSDSIVRITPLRGDWLDKSILLRELEGLTYIQGELMTSGVLLRGGLTIGHACTRADLAFGPAFNTAYEIESKYAVHPRIVLDPTIIAAYADLSDAGPSICAEDSLRLTRQDDDGRHFVDYLRNFPRELHDESWSDDRAELYNGYADARRQVIERGLKKYDRESPIGKKFAWLARYHNQVTREMSADSAALVVVA